MAMKKIIYTLLAISIIIASCTQVIYSSYAEDNVGDMIAKATEWLDMTHLYAEGSILSGIYEPFGLFLKLDEYTDKDSSFIVGSEKTVGSVTYDVQFKYCKVIYPGWNSLGDMYDDAAEIFCDDWVKRSIHSLVFPTGDWFESYEQFIEKDGALYTCTGLRVNGFEYSLEGNCIRPYNYSLTGVTSVTDIRGSIDSYKQLADYIEFPWQKYIASQKCGSRPAWGARVYDAPVYRVISENDSAIIAEVMVFDHFAVRSEAYKATLELKKTDSGWRVSGGTFMDAFYEGAKLEKMSESEFLSFITEVGLDEINPPKSPATGDDARRAVMAVGTAALAALIPVFATVCDRRKRGYEI